MSKKYDFKKALQIVNEKKELLSDASLGMSEDWSWTAESIIDDTKERTSVAGIDGSSWATPILQLEYKDGTKEVIDCYVKDNSTTVPKEEIDEMKAFAKATGGMDSVK